MGRNQVLAVRRAAVFAALVASVVGSGFMGRASAMPAGAVASGPTTPGYHMVTIKKAGFSLEVPNTWLALDPTSKSYAEVLRRVAAANPKLAPSLKQFSSVASSVVLFAVDQSDADFASNLSVVPLPLDKSVLSDPADVQTVLKAQLPQASGLKVQKTKVAGVGALVATAALNANRPDGSPYTAHLTAYFVASKSSVLDFDFSTSDDGRQNSTVQTMVNSLTLAGITPPISGQISPSRYVSHVCAALNTWDDKSNGDVSAPLKNVQATKQSLVNTRAQVVKIYAAETTATDRLIATTKAIGAPRMSNGNPVATNYLQTLNHARSVLSGAEHTAGSAPITSKAALTNAITTIDDKIVIDDPLDTLNKSSTLAAAIQADAGCGTVLDFYRPATTSGLLVGDCTDSKEQKVGCTQPHTDEVTLVTSYPGGPTARWPGNDVMSAFATQTCNTAFTSYVGIAVDQSKNTMAYFSPEPGSDWNGGDREIVCTVENADSSPQTGTLKGSAA